MLDGSSSYDLDGVTRNYSWVLDGQPLGDITDETLEEAIFLAYDQAGITYVTLTVEDGQVGTSSDTAMIVVYDSDGGFVTGGGWVD